jgi:hypothetical protein
MEIGIGMAIGMFKKKMDIDRQGPRLMPNNCQSLDPPYFSLPTTFKEKGFTSDPLPAPVEIPWVGNLGKVSLPNREKNDQER